MIVEKSVFTHQYQVFLNLLRKTRQARGLTQVGLAERLQETQSWISKCERGEHRLDIVELLRLCQAMEVSLEEFVREFESSVVRNSPSER